MLKFYEVLVYHCKDNVATVYHGRKRLKHIGFLFIIFIIALQYNTQLDIQ